VESLATNGSSATFLTGVVVENYRKPKSAEQGIMKVQEILDQPHHQLHS
jgi:hypothetical protein